MTIRAIIGRAEAKAQGLKRYFTGIPCSRGHVDERQVSWGRFATCNRENVFRKHKTPEGRANHLRHDFKWRASEKGKKSKRLSDARQYQAKSDEYKARSRLRRAREYGAEGDYTVADIMALLKKQNNKCPCDADFDVVKYTIDHVVPLSRGGSNWPTNLQILCSPCNDSKGAKLMCKWVVPMRRAA